MAVILTLNVRMKMIMKRKETVERNEKQELLSKSFRARVDLFQRALSGDCDALVECSYKFGICSKASFDDYFNSPYAKDPKIRTTHDWLSIFLTL